MVSPILYRKRIIPEECVLLKDDTVLYVSEDILVTKWNALRPKKNLHHGYSCYFLKEGYKISKFYRADHSLLYWYCDIIESQFSPDTNTYVVTDLLADVIVYPDGSVKVVDLDELATALDSEKLSLPQLKRALLSLNNLLTIIYAGNFATLQKPLEPYL